MKIIFCYDAKLFDIGFVIEKPKLSFNDKCGIHGCITLFLSIIYSINAMHNNNGSSKHLYRKHEFGKIWY